MSIDDAPLREDMDPENAENVDTAIWRIALAQNERLREQVKKAGPQEGITQDERVLVFIRLQEGECRLAIKLLIGRRDIPIPESYGIRLQTILNHAFLDESETDRILSALKDDFREALADALQNDALPDVTAEYESNGRFDAIASVEESVGKLIRYIRNPD